MKTSFYFFLWIIIYPLLGLIHNSWIYQNSFLVALFVVWGLSWILNKNMPHVIQYEKLSQINVILEEVYTGNVKAFKRRLTRMVTIEFITAVYLGVAFVFVMFSMMRGSADDWIALGIFGVFAIATIMRAVKLNQYLLQVKQNPVQEECAYVVDEAFNVNYASYYTNRVNNSVERMLPPRPRYFKAFQIVSMIIALLCALLGLFYLVVALLTLFGNSSAAGISGGIMSFLYGSLAAYFGIKDFIECLGNFNNCPGRT